MVERAFTETKHRRGGATDKLACIYRAGIVGEQAELERADIRPWAWVINNSLAAVRNNYARRLAVVPVLAAEPVRIPALELLTEPCVMPAR